MWKEVSGLLLAMVVCINASAHHTYLKIDKDTTNCGETFDVAVGNEIIVEGAGESPGVDCTYVFKGEMKDNCKGLCYSMQNGSFFRDDKVILTIVSGSHTMNYHTNRVNKEKPMCSEEMTLTASLTVALDYDPDGKKEGFGFTLEVYNRCEEPESNGDSITFEEALKHNKNYHHGEEFDNMVRMNVINGVLVGCGLASIFLIVLAVAFCYVKNSPHRGRKSASLNLSRPTEPSGQPENVQLLHMSSDPEKPPIGGATKS